MISSMGEQVDFNQDINPFENKKLPDRGYVKEVKPIENWLSDVEYQMRDSLRSNIVDSAVMYQEVEKKKWIFAWP